MSIVRPAWTPAVPFDVFEKSILELQAAQSSGTVSSRALVEAYLARIAAYDRAGPELNAIVTLNPCARADADALDHERANQGPRGPLHGIPVLVKDNYDTRDMPTTGGVLALCSLQPVNDAFQVQRLRRAGAVILGKTTMHELASGITTVSSLTGVTRNPYDPARVPGGSSGGTAAAIAASFAAAGMGTDTSGSIRIPAAHQNLVGLRVTQGLSSGAGVMPLSSTQDTAGPLARSVADLAILLDATVSVDFPDMTAAGTSKHFRNSYYHALDLHSLQGARIGVVRSLFGSTPEDEEIAGVVQQALDVMKGQGTELIEIDIAGLVELIRASSVTDHEFKFDLAEYLAQHPGAPVRSLDEILERGLYHAQLEERLRARNAPQSRDTQAYRRAFQNREALRATVLAVLKDQRLDALAYPTIQRQAVLIGEPQGGADAGQLSAGTGLPAIAVPAGFTRDGLPAGMELLGDAFTEPTLLALAHAWEQLTKPRRAPFSTPPLVDGRAPKPITFEASIDSLISDASARMQFSFETTTSVLQFEAAVTGFEQDRLIALTLQRSNHGGPGPVLAHLLTSGQKTASSKLTLRAADREALLAGELYAHLYTHRAPLGAGRSAIQPVAHVVGHVTSSDATANTSTDSVDQLQ